MASSMCRQVSALVWRYGIVITRSPIRSLLRIILWPGFFLVLSYWLLSNLDKEDEEYRKATKKTLLEFLSPLLSISTVFHLFSFSEYFIKDKSTLFKSLMISMGLKRSSYHSANAICMVLCILPISTAMAIICSIYLYDDSEASTFIIILMFILFTIQLIAVVFALVSFITSSSFAFVVPVILLVDMFLFGSIRLWVKKSGEMWRPFILFFVSLSPYNSIRIFSDSYLVNKNNGTTEFNDNHVSQPTYLILVALTFWTIVCYMFALWFEQVCPWQKDSAVRKPCFCLESKVRHEEILGTEEMSQRSSKYFERQAHNRDVGIRLNHVTKSFRNVPAVNDLTFDIHKGETTLLLGHNGAGKTTLMNIILGMLEPDKGKVAIRGRMEERPALGVCPQTSVLDEDLSVKQHIALFVDIKSNLTNQERSQHIKQTVDDVSLGPHIDKRPGELSGGMKRKLSLGMAFAGQSDVLILDEPSSGLDPDSRVFVWNAIRRYRADRTVLLSTQHMEEADYLGDRIAIMSDGRLVCCGSSVFLNNLFGTGYKLRIECDPTRKKSILQYIKQFFNETIEADTGQTDYDQTSSAKKSKQSVDFVVELRNNDKSKDIEVQMIKLLEDLEANSQRLGVRSFGLKSSSIEDVMLETSKYFAVEPTETTRLTMTSTSAHLTTLADSQKAHDVGNHIMQAMLMKHVHTNLANWKSYIFFRLLVPALAAYQIADFLNPRILDIMNSSYNPSTFPVFLVFHFVQYPVLERASKFKIVQLTSSANYVYYWLSQLMFDSITVITNTILVNVCFVIFFKSEAASSLWTIHAIISVATILFSYAALIFSYVLSTILSDPKTAVGYNILIYDIGVIASLIVTVLKVSLPSTNFKLPEDIVTYIFVTLIPTDAYQYIMFGLISERYVTNIHVSVEQQAAPEPPFGPSPLIYGAGVLLFQIMVYLVLLCLVEMQSFDLEWYCRPTNLCSCLFGTKKCPIGPRTSMDDDVIDETAKAISVIKNIPRDAYSLVAADLNKSYYVQNPVVEGLSFTVGKGECFGLLGVNGAGKTTTFSMITAESAPDSGKVWANGNYSHQGLSSYREHIGYDPQPNPEISLSPHKALYLMARLRKVPEFRIPVLINSVLELLEMGQHAHKPTSDLSGGTKRKLALGMALIGNPDLLALDEPTAGVDPVARRGIWRLLKTLRSQNSASIIISSHAMEECEAICDRISVMARGRLRCIGTFLHLRSKFAQGCSLRVQFGSSSTISSSSGNFVQETSASMQRRSSAVDSIVLEIQQRLKEAVGANSVKLADKNANNASFTLNDNRVRRSLLFKIMREFRQKHSNISYMINDSSLEDIFISIAREQQQLEHPTSDVAHPRD